MKDCGGRVSVSGRQCIDQVRVKHKVWALPIGEVVLGLLLLVGLLVRWAGLATALLMAAFITGISSVWARGYSIDCGCFGGGGDISPAGRALRYTQEIIRDGAFTGMALWLYRWPATRWALERL